MSLSLLRGRNALHLEEQIWNHSLASFQRRRKAPRNLQELEQIDRGSLWNSTYPQHLQRLPHIRVDLPPGSPANLPQGRKKTRPISIQPENRLLSVPAVHHVVNRPRVLQPGLPGHAPFSLPIHLPVNQKINL